MKDIVTQHFMVLICLLSSLRKAVLHIVYKSFLFTYWTVRPEVNSLVVNFGLPCISS